MQGKFVPKLSSYSSEYTPVVLFFVGDFRIERRTISSAAPSDSDPDWTTENLVREEDLEAEAEGGAGEETDVWERREAR